MKLVTFTDDDARSARVGVLVDDGLVDLRGAPGVPASMVEIAEGGASALGEIDRFLARGPEVVTRSSVHLLAPVPRPGKIVGVGLNYSEHVDESNRTLDTAKELPERPVLFGKPSTAVVGPDGEIRHDGSLTRQLDWESELAVVIGRAGRNIAAEHAFDYVFGYSIINDISARDQRRSGQWFFSKGQDTYAPFGPCIVPAREFSDPHDLRISLRVNGATKQDSSTRHMLFKIPELIADITSGMTLEPGDVIATGSPSGVGAGRVPPQFLQPGDVVEAEVEGIGVLRNRVVDAREQRRAA